MAMASPGMTTADTFYGQIKSFEKAMPPESFDSVLGTGRLEPASRTEQRRDRILIEPDQSDE
jgi:hypothetical protein